MEPIKIIIPYLDAITPTVDSCTYTECEDEYSTEILIPDHHALMDLIQDITLKIASEIAGYKSRGAYPFDDATDDISNAISVLQELDQHIWD